MSVAKHVASV